jgi:predicted TIM-barrel fold metal-dependent hydrolase
MTLMYNGVLDRYPNINWIMSHGGGAVPYLGYRIGAAPRIADGYKTRVKRPVAEYLRSIHYNLASADSLCS